MLKLNLHLFDEGAEGGTEAAPSINNAESEGVTGNIEDNTQQVTDAEESFEELVKGKYKDDAKDYFKKTFDKRFAKIKGESEKKVLQAEEKLNGLIDTLSSRYNGERDPQKLIELLNSDEELLSSEAFRRGISVDELRMERREAEFERKEQMLERRLSDIEQEKQARENWAKITQQAEEFKSIYPTFDLSTEMQDETFRKTLAATNDVKATYMAVHSDEMLSAIAQNAFEKGREKTVQSIKNKASRPMENGAQSHAAATVKKDVSKLTPEERKSLVERALRGEIVTF